MVITWDDSLKLGIAVIDAQHKLFVDTLGELIKVVDDPNHNKDIINQIFEKISKYRDIHFKTEEEFFDKFHYEGAQEHKTEHEKFRKKFAKLKEQYLTDTIEATFNLADFLEDWLLNHLKTMDSKYVECFHAHGLY
jgi:hemerythrin